MKVVVNDANILIDLAELGLLDEFAQLNFDLHTVDVIVEEMSNHQQKECVLDLARRGLLVIASLRADEYEPILRKKARCSGLSFQDCAAWYYAEVHKGMLLTGDGRLRRNATDAHLEVRGILFIFDQLVDAGILEKPAAAVKLYELLRINTRLPIAEVKRRIALWQGQ